MSRTIKFRVWDRGFYRFGSLDDIYQVGYICGLTKPISDMFPEQFTGLIDSQGREIYEGDILLASEARYEMTLAEPSDGLNPSIYVVDHDKPLPAPDVPWFKAVVEWNESMCGFWLRYLEKRADWGPGISTALNDKHYTHTVVGNVHEAPITSSGSTS